MPEHKRLRVTAIGENPAFPLNPNDIEVIDMETGTPFPATEISIKITMDEAPQLTVTTNHFDVVYEGDARIIRKCPCCGVTVDWETPNLVKHT